MTRKRRTRSRRRISRPVLILGLLIGLAGLGFLGLKLTENGVFTVMAVTEEGTKVYLSKELQLNDFVVEHYSNGVPRHFFAEISIDGKPARLEVNHPYAANWAEDYYLTSYDVQSEQPRYCVVQIVREPLKYVMWVGIVMMLCGGCLLFLAGPNEPYKALSETSR